MLLVGAFSFAPTARATYHKEMADFAKVLNESASESGLSASYDPTNDCITLKFPKSFFTDEEAEIFSDIDLSTAKPLLINQLVESMGNESCTMFGTLLDSFNTKLAIEMQLGDKTRTITISGKELLEAAQ